MMSLEKVTPGSFPGRSRRRSDILGHGVAAVHLFQQAVTAGLHRQVDMLAQMLLRGDGVDQLAAGVLGMAGHEADLVSRRARCRAGRSRSEKSIFSARPLP